MAYFYGEYSQSQVEAISGVPFDTIRQYQRLGLIKPKQKPSASGRVELYYTDEIIKQIQALYKKDTNPQKEQDCDKDNEYISVTAGKLIDTLGCSKITAYKYIRAYGVKSPITIYDDAPQYKIKKSDLEKIKQEYKANVEKYQPKTKPKPISRTTFKDEVLNFFKGQRDDFEIPLGEIAQIMGINPTNNTASYGNLRNAVLSLQDDGILKTEMKSRKIFVSLQKQPVGAEAYALRLENERLKSKLDKLEAENKILCENHKNEVAELENAYNALKAELKSVRDELSQMIKAHNEVATPTIQIYTPQEQTKAGGWLSRFFG